jgi:hypothetical protein
LRAVVLPPLNCQLFLLPILAKWRHTILCRFEPRTGTAV